MKRKIAEKESGVKTTVLIVDDAPLMRDMLRQILEKGRYQVVAEAVNGVEAVQKYREHKPQITLMDLVMPVKDGVQAMKEILQLEPLANVIVCSLPKQTALIAEAIKSGAWGLLLKPYDIEEVLETLGRHSRS